MATEKSDVGTSEGESMNYLVENNNLLRSSVNIDVFMPESKTLQSNLLNP